MIRYIKFNHASITKDAAAHIPPLAPRFRTIPARITGANNTCVQNFNQCSGIFNRNITHPCISLAKHLSHIGIAEKSHEIRSVHDVIPDRTTAGLRWINKPSRWTRLKDIRHRHDSDCSEFTAREALPYIPNLSGVANRIRRGKDYSVVRTSTHH